MNIQEKDGFKYVDEGKGKILLLLHGLFGALSNWETVIRYFSKNYRVIIPILPIYELPVKDTGLEGLVAFIEDFVNHKSLNDLTLLGNSLGGHLALIYTLNNPEKVKKYLKNWYIKNKQKLHNYKKQYFEKHPNYERDRSRKRRKQWKENPIKYTEEIQRDKEYKKQWRKDNPSSNRSESIELQLAMNNVRKRDNSTCQWYGCNLSFRSTMIDVHHIFPRKEYPELELIESYMICYCRDHHYEFHSSRGDNFGFLEKPYK